MQSQAVIRNINDEKLTKLASIITKFKNVNAVIQERVRLNHKIEWLHFTDEQLSQLDVLLEQHPSIAEMIKVAEHHLNFNDVLILSDNSALLKLALCFSKLNIKRVFDHAIVTSNVIQTLVQINERQLTDLDELFQHPDIVQLFHSGRITLDHLLYLRKDARKRLLCPAVIRHLKDDSICMDEVLRLDSLNSEDTIQDYLRHKSEKERLYQELGLQLSDLSKAKLCVFDSLFIRKSFGKNHPRAIDNLHDVLVLSDEDRVKLQSIIPAYLDLFFFNRIKMPIDELVALTRDEKKFIDNALLADDGAVLEALRNGQFRRVYQPVKQNNVFSFLPNAPRQVESTPLIDVQAKAALLIDGLVAKLQAYIKRIDEHRDANNILFPDFSHGFRFFIAWQSDNRRANYCLAKELCIELKKNDPDLAAIFQRSAIRKLRYKEGAPCPTTGIHSDDINAILSEARGFISKNKLRPRLQA